VALSSPELHSSRPVLARPLLECNSGVHASHAARAGRLSECETSWASLSLQCSSQVA
jgi:hypothetical protein